LLSPLLPAEPRRPGVVTSDLIDRSSSVVQIVLDRPQIIQVIWDLSVRPSNDSSASTLTASAGRPRPVFLTYLAEHGITFEQAAAASQAASSGRNRRETSLWPRPSCIRRSLRAATNRGCAQRQDRSGRNTHEYAGAVPAGP
jgi:hypothetical protein